MVTRSGSAPSRSAHRADPVASAMQAGSLMDAAPRPTATAQLPAIGPEEVRALLRSASVVMRLARLGSFHGTRVSFMRSLVRRMARERWRFVPVTFELDRNGYGTVVYEIRMPEGLLSFVAFSNYLAPEERTDRVIAEKWDAAFALVAGRADASAVERLRSAVPRQEAARYTADELVLSRANKSVRLFEAVASVLAQGRQPELAEIIRVGYLMRTTAVYSNGKFGMADLGRVWEDGVFTLPYEAEMLTVYMVRQFSFDLVEHIARQQNVSGAVRLDRAVKRALGIGNATGLGMAPFLAGHPKLINNWILARETALARVRAVEEGAPARRQRFRALLDRAICHIYRWTTDDERQTRRIATMRTELSSLRRRLDGGATFPADPRPWDRLVRWAERTQSLETSELLNSLVIELYPELVDDLERTTGSDEREDLDPGMSLRALKQLVEHAYGWALRQRYDTPDARHFFWYRSAEKDEPRLGERFNEPGAEKELPLGIGQMVAALHVELSGLAAEELDRSVAAFLLARPRWRGIVRRVQTLAGLPYAEIRDNLLGRDCLPIDMLRCKLSIFGATKFDPKSDRWTRITMYQGAPTVEELASPDADDWAFPCFQV